MKKTELGRPRRGKVVSKRFCVRLLPLEYADFCKFGGGDFSRGVRAGLEKLRGK